ncbi:1-phosphofructokinase [Hydrocarboniphaga effusa]|uniref:1-phosphofructokinase n=1 Tax=Hydrocarboniphaga effusa TaxID=243629 RepID=UPI00398BCF20
MSAPVVTVTLNPALDQTVLLDSLRPGAVNRANSVRLDAGGKGVNVASCLADWGLPTVATGLLGRDNTSEFEKLFARKGIADRFVRIAGQTRTNLKIVAADCGDTTDINLPGAQADADSFAQVHAAVGELCDRQGIAVFAGSLPAGIDTDAYVTLLRQAAACGMRSLLDTSDAPLTAALQSETVPYAIKPNRHELEGWCGRKLDTPARLLTAARELQSLGIVLVVISMGAEGALFVGSDREALIARPPAIRTQSTVGAGDAMVAGIAAAMIERRDPESLARLATAFAAAKLGLAGPNLPAREQVLALADATRIERLR